MTTSLLRSMKRAALLAMMALVIAAASPGRALAVLMLDAQLGSPKAIGTIPGTRRQSYGLLRFFMRDKGRFPQTGGYSVPLGAPFAIRLEDSKRQPSATWGPYEAAPGSLTDIELTL